MFFLNEIFEIKFFNLHKKLKLVVDFTDKTKYSIVDGKHEIFNDSFVNHNLCLKKMILNHKIA